MPLDEAHGTSEGPHPWNQYAAMSAREQKLNGASHANLTPTPEEKRTQLVGQ